MATLKIESYVARISETPLARWSSREPWDLTAQVDSIVRALINSLPSDFAVTSGIAVHRAAKIEDGAVVKEPAIIGPDCLVAAGAYLRGGIWLEAGCVVGPGSELKSSIVFRSSSLAHFNFVGDSILGSGVNLEAGSIIANYRNERDNKKIAIVHDGAKIETGVEKFGAIVGDGCQIGANAVIAPGSALAIGTAVGRLSLVDQTDG